MPENVMQFPGGARTMTLEQYQTERQKIVGDSREEAGNRWEQDLAKLFRRSGWTQEQLAKQEGKHQTYIGKLLKFGEFLAFVENNPIGLKSTNALKSLSEGRFRGFWERTERTESDKRDDQMKRFLEILRMMEKEIKGAVQEIVKGKPETPQAVPYGKNDLQLNFQPIPQKTVSIQQTPPPSPPPALPSIETAEMTKRSSFKTVGERMMKKFADGKWHSIEEIMIALTEPREKVAHVLERMMHAGAFNSECSSKQVGTTFHYRMVHQTKMISADELATKLSPIVKKLIEQGNRNMTTMSPPTVAYLAGLLKQLLDEWTK